MIYKRSKLTCQLLPHQSSADVMIWNKSLNEKIIHSITCWIIVSESSVFIYVPVIFRVPFKECILPNAIPEGVPPETDIRRCRS